METQKSCFGKINDNVKKTIAIFVIGMGYYLYRLALIPNCLFRLDSQNIERFCLGAIPEGLIGPLRSIYLAVKHRGVKNGIIVFKELFLTLDNPIIIFSSLSIISSIFL